MQRVCAENDHGVNAARLIGTNELQIGGKRRRGRLWVVNQAACLLLCERQVELGFARCAADLVEEGVGIDEPDLAVLIEANLKRERLLQQAIDEADKAPKGKGLSLPTWFWRNKS